MKEREQNVPPIFIFGKFHKNFLFSTTIELQ